MKIRSQNIRGRNALSSMGKLSFGLSVLLALMGIHVFGLPFPGLYSPGVYSPELYAAERSGPVLIGAVSYLWGPTRDVAGLRDGLMEMGYREGLDFVIGSRSGEGDAATLSAAIRQLVRDGAQIVYANGRYVLDAARREANGIPTVFATWYNPLGSGDSSGAIDFVHGLTGTGNALADVQPEALDVFASLVPGLKRVLVPYDSRDPQHLSQLRLLRKAAARLRLRIVARAVATRAQAKAAIMGAEKADIDGILPAGGRLNIAGYALQASLQHKIPALFSRQWMADYGGLASYGPDWYGLGREAAKLTARIIEGENPTGIPPVVRNRNKLVINLRAAKALGLNISDNVVKSAARLIE